MAVHLLLDENISPLVAAHLRDRGYDAIHLTEVGLGGSKDAQVLAFARQAERCLVTLDAEFADVRRYPPGSHCGIIRLRIRFAPADVVASALDRLLPQLDRVPLDRGALVVSDGRRYRVKLPKSSRED